MRTSDSNENPTISVNNQDAVISVNQWISVEDRLPDSLQTVWISNGKGWTTLGCRSEYDHEGNWCWAETNGVIYEEDGKIVSECEEEDLDVIFWSPLPQPPNDNKKRTI